MKALSLFANIGVAEAYLDKIGVKVVVANELIKRRADLYSKIYPNTDMVCGDITEENTYETIKKKSRDEGIDVIIATPPCQGFSRACRNRDENDSRNLLIMPVISLVKDVNPRYVFIENVPQLLETEITIDGRKTLIQDYMIGELGDKYSIFFHQINTENYGVPQSRRRTIILLTRKDQKIIWELPEENENRVTLEDAIGDLPPLDPFIKDVDEKEFKEMFPEYEKKKNVAKKVSIWHQPPIHIKRQVVTMIHTPTGKTAFDNKKYIPRKEDGTAVKGYKSTYRRLRWIDPASTVTMDNRKISSQNNVHPGHYLGEDENGDVVYSDPRVLSLFELMRVMSLPDDWPLPSSANVAFVRSVIGEGIPPLFVKKVFEKIIIAGDGDV
ncbi:MAG TPA: DNA cytosine methyltransferase [Candidatus Acetatifactor stercoripullorum]|uniref:Cytosine-specific methyltransferase n=1 Tax=Candidatus Acetatifactor stercoripullorum TaxID=2838414 RepID=A0A9D1R4X0_9FIRM|nr:DNA cytosine methyltransferase [uncultured Acetatifactor sp.]HIW80167.1 DNA cytosine methyltransferase [Candidatus Acetatifactor stercoripullorum]